MADRDQTEQGEIAQDMPTTNMRPYPGTPRWVKVFAIVTLVIIVLVGIMLIGGHLGSGHGPSLHMPSGHSGSDAESTSVTDHEGK